MTRPPSLLRKVKRYLRLQGEIRRRYKLLDALEEEILPPLKARNRPLRLGRRATQAVILEDNFAEKNKAFRAHGISRFELKVVDV